MRARPIIALLTDFGAADWFVGSMKAAILERVPDGTIVDLCHAIEPGAVAQGAWLLQKTSRDFPAGTVFCAVVDPGVGTARRALAAAADDHFFVAPDNGLLTGVRRPAKHWECRAIDNATWRRPSVSRTFHGRDVFAPAAAEVARDGGIERAGDPIADLVAIEPPQTRVAPDGSIEGAIVYFDRFGNAVTTIERECADARDPGKPWRLVAEGLTIPSVTSTYADVAEGESLAYWGSLATLEIAVRGGDARKRLGLQLGARVRLV